MDGFFKFEDENIDIPFYNGQPKLTKFEWILLIIAEILFLSPILLPIYIPNKILPFYLCLIILIPVLYVSRGNWNLFFKKIKRKDIKLIIACVILPYIYSMAMLGLLEYLKIASNQPIQPNHVSAFAIITTIIQLIGEEFFKIILLIIIMSLIYNFTKNRKHSIVISTIMTMIVFGCGHLSYGPLIQVLLIQGLGSIFDLYAYLKTKNILVSYSAHLIFDLIPFAMEIIFVLLTGQAIV